MIQQGRADQSLSLQRRGACGDEHAAPAVWEVQAPCHSATWETHHPRLKHSCAATAVRQ